MDSYVLVGAFPVPAWLFAVLTLSGLALLIFLSGSDAD